MCGASYAPALFRWDQQQACQIMMSLSQQTNSKRALKTGRKASGDLLVALCDWAPQDTRCAKPSAYINININK